jgi:hypothetical protein
MMGSQRARDSRGSALSNDEPVFDRVMSGSRRALPHVSWRGGLWRGGGYAQRLPQVDMAFGSSRQVSGGFWPFSTGMSLPVEGVPIGRLTSTGAAVCCDPITWYQRDIVPQPSMFVLGQPAIGKSTFVRRQVWGLKAFGVNAVIPGDLKGEYVDLVSKLGGQVIPLGPGLGSLNILDPGDVHQVLKRLTGPLREDLLRDYQLKRSETLEVVLSIVRTKNNPLTDIDMNLISVGLEELYACTKDDPLPPTVVDLRDLIVSAPLSLRAVANFDDPQDDAAYRSVTRSLLGSLNGLATPYGRFKSMFCSQSTDTVDLSRPVVFDIQALDKSGDDMVAAALAASWSAAFAAKNASDMLAEAGLQPRRNHVIVMDEMHRALRSSPLMVERLDLLTRLNRQWGFGQIMITHTVADLMCLGSEEENMKALGFVTRSAIKVMGALDPHEIDKFLRGEVGMSISKREEDLLDDWNTPLGYGTKAAWKGRGKFLVKSGNLPGLPTELQLCPTELGGFNDTDRKWEKDR